MRDVQSETILSMGGAGVKDIIKIIISFLIWSVGAVFMLGFAVTVAAVDFFKDFSEGSDDGKRWKDNDNRDDKGL